MKRTLATLGTALLVGCTITGAFAQSTAPAPKMASTKMAGTKKTKMAKAPKMAKATKMAKKTKMTKMAAPAKKTS